MSTTAPPAAAVSRGGKYLTFFVASEEYGVEILKVQEIIGMQPITRVPRTPVCMRGVINLRGKVIPVVDLRERFDLPSAEDALAGATDVERQAAAAVRCTIVVQVAGPDGRPVPMGIAVDRVSEVAAVADDDVEDAPSFGASVRTEYLLGLAKSKPAESQGAARSTSGKAAEGGRVRLLLDIDRVLAADELTQVVAAGDA